MYIIYTYIAESIILFFITDFNIHKYKININVMCTYRKCSLQDCIFSLIYPDAFAWEEVYFMYKIRCYEVYNPGNRVPDIRLYEIAYTTYRYNVCQVQFLCGTFSIYYIYIWTLIYLLCREENFDATRRKTYTINFLNFLLFIYVCMST